MYSSYFCLFVAGTSSPEEKEVFFRESAVLKLIGEHENIVHLMFDGLKSGTDEATHRLSRHISALKVSQYLHN